MSKRYRIRELRNGTGILVSPGGLRLLVCQPDGVEQPVVDELNKLLDRIEELEKAAAQMTNSKVP